MSCELLMVVVMKAAVCAMVMMLMPTIMTVITMEAHGRGGR